VSETVNNSPMVARAGPGLRPGASSSVGDLIRSRRARPVLLLAPIGVWLGLFLIAPIAIMFAYSLWQADPTTFTIVREFDTGSYDTVFGEGVYLSVLLKSLWIGLLVVLLTLVLGFPTAYLLASRKTERAKMVLLLLLLVPFWTSVLLRSYAWILVLGEAGAVNSVLQSTGIVSEPLRWLLFDRFAVVISLVQLYVPFMVIALYAVLEKFDWRLLEAARDLGAGKLRSFVHIILPASLPGILIGVLLVFIPAVGSFITPSLLGGTDGLMYAGVISSQFGTSFNWPLGAALSFVLVVALVIVVTVLMKVVRPWDSFERGMAS
jgi:spermidine/putrescine transport system permease protein